MRVIVTGGTGTIGRALCHALVADGHEVIVLSRSLNPKVGLPDAVRLAQWDGRSAGEWGRFVDGADAIVNFAGEGLADGLWSDARKQRIYASRVEAGQAVVEVVAAATNKPKVVVQASAIGYYGPHGDEELTESSAPGADFLAQVCFDWEASTAAVERMGVRRVVIRTGIVLTNQGGAWPKIVLPFKLFAGGPMGSGKQVWSWIHLEDEIRAIQFLLANPDAQGAFNLTAPEPMANRDFARTLGAVMGRPAFLPAPAPALKIVLGEMSTVLLDGQRAVPSKLQELGFTYSFPSAKAAFEDLLS